MVSIQHLSCSATLQRLNTSGSVSGQDEIKTASVYLCRNEFGIMIINVADQKTDRKVNIPVTNPDELRIFQRFINDGKVSIQVGKAGFMILLKNAPVDQLKTLMKALVCKAKVKGKIPSQSERLFSVKSHSLVDISPLMMNDIKNGSYISPNSRVVRQAKLPLQTPSARVNDRKQSLKRSIYTPETKENSSNPKMSKYSSTGCLETPSTKKMIRSTSERQLVSRACVPASKVNLYTLGDEQQRVLSAVKSGINIFLTGCAGTGKSFLLKRIIGMLSPEDTFVTASTGVAASQIGGITLHSFAGIGSGNGDFTKELTMAQRPGVVTQWRRCKHLIIDEISMVDASFFTKLDRIAQVIRQNDRPFGGMQVICSGDFLQLPPVGDTTKSNDETSSTTTIALPNRFAFQSPAWDTCFNDASRNVMLLRTVYRQNDNDFIKLLRLIRLGKCNDAVVSALKKTQSNQLVANNSINNGISATKLCTHNADAEFINGKQLDALPGDAKIFK